MRQAGKLYQSCSKVEVLFGSIQQKCDSCTFFHFQLLSNIPCPLVTLQYSRIHVKGSYIRLLKLREVRIEVGRLGGGGFGLKWHNVHTKFRAYRSTGLKVVMGEHRQEAYPARICSSCLRECTSI